MILIFIFILFCLIFLSLFTDTSNESWKIHKFWQGGEDEELRILIKDVLDREGTQESVGNSYLAEVLAVEILKAEKKCKWLSCWWGAVTVPGRCAKNGNMRDINCPLFLDEEEYLKERIKRGTMPYARVKN